jgi:osmotically-inducible protein OsmY
MAERRAGLGRWLWLGLAALACGCGGRDAEHLARIGRTATSRLRTLTEGARAQLHVGWQNLRTSSDEASLDGRVAARLRWDKALADTDIRVSSPSAGVVHLEGTVTTPGQRDRAVELAFSTQGVERVLNKLTSQGE